MVQHSLIVVCLSALLGSGPDGARAAPAQTPQPPAWLPHYDLAIRLDPDKRLVKVVERITWINRHARPAQDLVFNAHARYTIPDGQVGTLAKTVELLRVAPKEALVFDGPALNVQAVRLLPVDPATGIARVDLKQPPPRLKFDYPAANPTALTVNLPQAVGPGQSVTF